MDFVLTPIEARIIGALIEKEASTPDYYPLTLNALAAACNQKSNRDPVMSLDEKDLARSLEELSYGKGLAGQVTVTGSRVPKYRHNLLNKLSLSPPEKAVLCVLLLRGPQTMGKLRSRTARLHRFAALAEVEAALRELIEWEGSPLVAELPPSPGQREHRFAHLLCGPVEVDESASAPPADPAVLEVRAENERLSALEADVAALREQVESLKTELAAFKEQFA